MNLERLWQYVSANNKTRINTYISRLKALEKDKLSEIIPEEKFVEILLKMAPEIFKDTLNTLINVLDETEAGKLSEQLLIQAIQTDNFPVMQSLFSKLRAFPAIKAYISNDNLDENLRKTTNTLIMAEYAISYCDYNKIYYTEIQNYTAECQPILHAAQEFYYAVYSEQNMSFLKHFTQALEINPYFILKLLREVMLSIFTQDRSIPNYNFLKWLLPLVKELCKDDVTGELTKYYNVSLVEFYAIDFDQCLNKTLFKDDQDKKDFFQHKMDLSEDSLILKKPEIIDDSENEILEIGPIADAFFDLDMGNQEAAIKKLLLIKVEKFDAEVKKAISDLTRSDNKQIAAKAYYMEGDIHFQDFHAEDVVTFLTPILGYFIKSYILGYEISLNAIKNILNLYGLEYLGNFKKDPNCISFLQSNFQDYLEKVVNFINGKYEIINIEDEIFKINFFKIFKSIISENNKLFPEAILYLGYLYSNPAFALHDTAEAYKYFKEAIQLKCDISLLEELAKYYSSGTVKGSEDFAYLLESDPRIKKSEEKQYSYTLSQKDIVNNFIQSIQLKRPKFLDKKVEDLSGFLKSAITDLTNNKALLSNAARIQALAIVKIGNSENRELYKTALDKIHVALALNEEIFKLLTNEPKQNSKEYLFAYLKVISEEIEKHASDNRSLHGLKNELEVLMDAIQPKTFRSTFSFSK